MSDAVDRAAEVIAPIIANATACGYDPKGTCGTCRADSALIAKALADAGLLTTEWQIAECDDEVYEGRCHDEMHANFEMEKLESVRTEVRKGVYEYRDLRPRRLVGPWVWPEHAHHCQETPTEGGHHD